MKGYFFVFVLVLAIQKAKRYTEVLGTYDLRVFIGVPDCSAILSTARETCFLPTLSISITLVISPHESLENGL